MACALEGGSLLKLGSSEGLWMLSLGMGRVSEAGKVRTTFCLLGRLTDISVESWIRKERQTLVLRREDSLCSRACHRPEFGVRQGLGDGYQEE